MAKKKKVSKKSTKKTTKKSVKKTTKKASAKTTKKSAKSSKKQAPKAAKKSPASSSKKSAPKKSAAPKPVKAVNLSSLKVGDSVSDLSLPSTGGDFRLSDLKGKKVVLFFYPKDATPGCTIEGNEFSQLLPEFQKKNAVVYGISRDSLKSHDSFKSNQKFTFELLSDSDERACQLFDVIKEKNMYGKMVMGVERSTFVIDENGKLLKEWRKVKAEGHANEVLNSI